MRPVAYGQPKCPELWAALRTDCDVRPWVGCARELEAGRTAVIGGLQFDSPALLGSAMARGDFVFVDRAYFGGGYGKGVFRLVPNAYQKNWIERRPADRWERLGVTARPWRKGRHVLVCPPSSPQLALFFNCGKWLDETLAALSEATDRPVKVRRKYDPEPLERALDDAHAVVCFTSNVAVEAAVAGVPVFVDARSAAAPVGKTDAREIESPAYPDREGWLRSLAYGQFSIDEIKEGTAWRLLKF